MRFLAFADVQGNPWAARALLLAAKKLDDVEVVCLGNAVGTGADPSLAVERLRKARVHLVRGPRDAAAIGMPGPSDLRIEGKANAAKLAPADLAFLKEATPPRRLVANGKRILLTSQESGDMGQADVVLRPGPKPNMIRGATRLELVTGRADNAAGESPYVLYNAETGEAKVLYAVWDRASRRERAATDAPKGPNL